MQISKDIRPPNEEASISAYVVFILVLIAPFSTIAYFAFPMPTIGGKNFWVAAPFITLAGIAGLSIIYNPPQKNHFNIRTILFLGFLCIAVVVTRSFAYEEAINAIGFRYIITIPIYIVAISIASTNKKSIDVLEMAIIAQGVLTALFMCANAICMPHVHLTQTELGASGISISGNHPRTLLIGVSIGAGHIFLGMLAIVKKYIQTPDSSPKYFLVYLALIIMTYAILTGGSRLPIAMSMTLIAFAVFKPGLNNTFWSFLKAFIIFLGILFLARYLSYWLMDLSGYGFRSSNDFGNPLFRFNENSGGRVEKLLLAVEMICESWFTFLFGASEFRQTTLRSVDGYFFSDNSFAYVLLNLGAFLGGILIFRFLIFIQTFWTNLLSKFFVVYFLLCLGLTNSILWDPFLFTSLLTAAVLNSNVLQKKNN